MGFCYFLETQKHVALRCDGGNVTPALHVAPNEEEQSEKRRIVRRNIEGERESTYHSNCPKVFHCICTACKWAQISRKKCLTYDVCFCVSVNLSYFQISALCGIHMQTLYILKKALYTKEMLFKKNPPF